MVSIVQVYNGTIIIMYTILRLNKKLDEVEKKYSMLHKRSDMEYKENLYAILLGKKEQLLFEIWKTGQRRIFLLNLKENNMQV